MKKHIFSILLLVFLFPPFIPGFVQAEDSLEVRALLVPEQEAVLSSRIKGQIVKLPFKEGTRFQKGQLLIALDCDELRAEEQKARMDLEAARETHDANLRLQEFGSVSDLDVAVSSAKQKRAQAQVVLVETKVAMCDIKAPFGGRVVKHQAHPFENVTPEDPILEIINDRKLKLHILVPSSWLLWLKNGHDFEILVDETGKKYEAKVTGLGARINPVNQTLEVEAAVQGRHPELLAGMSGTARFMPPQQTSGR